MKAAGGKGNGYQAPYLDQEDPKIRTMADRTT